MFDIKNITRKCYLCKKKIDIETENNFILYNNKFCHINCFIQNKTNLKRNKWSIERCNSEIQKLIPITQSYIKPLIKKHQLYLYLSDVYNVTVFSKRFYEKIESIVHGSYKNITKPIPAEDLLDMWQRKQKYLDKINIRNQCIGKKIIGEQRINYDLAILLSKYDSYLAWKKEKQIKQREIQQRNESINSQINYDNVWNKTENNDNIIDIDKILDEI